MEECSVSNVHRCKIGLSLNKNIIDMYRKHKMFQELTIIAITMLALDFIYISASMKLFQNQIIEVQKTSLQLRPLGAFLCYVFLIFGLYYFIVKPHRPVGDAVLLGLVIYGVYETTSYAILKNWKLNIVAMDTLWGGALFGLTTIITYGSMKYLL